jgi:glycosyltransferase involved in cell wall biosynthesis
VEREKRVVVFGITGAPAAAGEVADIASIAREASQTIPNLHLVVIGRGSSEVHEDLANALKGSPVSLDVGGVMPAEEVTRELLRADALLFVRGPVMIRRGSAQAGIACGLPIVGYGDSEPSGLIAEAGIEWAPWRDWKALAHALARVLTDPQRWTELHERNLRVQEKYFSWNRISELFIEALAE